MKKLEKNKLWSKHSAELGRTRRLVDRQSREYHVYMGIYTAPSQRVGAWGGRLSGGLAPQARLLLEPLRWGEQSTQS